MGVSRVSGDVGDYSDNTRLYVYKIRILLVQEAVAEAPTISF